MFGVVIVDSSSGNSPNDTPYLLDFQNGTYEITYKIGDSGEYVMHVQLMRNGTASGEIRGSPFYIKCTWGN